MKHGLRQLDVRQMPWDEIREKYFAPLRATNYFGSAFHAMGITSFHFANIINVFLLER